MKFYSFRDEISSHAMDRTEMEIEVEECEEEERERQGERTIT